MGEHICVHRASLREFLLVITPHFLYDRRLAVYVFVVRKLQHIQLIVEIEHRECELVVLRGALGGRGAEVIQRVVHPAEIPLVVEAHAVILYGAGDLRECGRVLRDEHTVRVQPLQTRVHLLYEVDGVGVYAAFGLTLPVYRAADSVHSQSVKVIFFQPVICA